MTATSPSPAGGERRPARPDDEEPARDLRYPSKGGPSVDGRPGASPRISARLPAELQARAAALARWRRTSVGAVVRAALDHHLDEGVGGRAGMPRPGRCAVPRGLDGPEEPDLAQACAEADAHPDGGTVAEEC